MNPRIVDKDEKRAEILTAATRIFARRGYAATRIEDVALEAGVAKGTIYIYFGSRGEILLAAFESFEQQLMAGVRSALETNEPALQRLRAVVRTVLESMEAEPELARIVLDFWAAGAFEGEARIDFGRVYAEYRHIMANLLEEAKREGSVRRDLPEDTPVVIVGTLEGILLQWIVDLEAVPLGRMTEPVLDVVLGGLAVREQW